MNRPHEAIRGVVFDLDGLMFNTETLYQEVGTELLRRRGREFTEDLIRQMMGRPGGVALQLMIDYHGLKDTVATLEQESDAIFEEILESRLAPMPGLMELLAHLEVRGIPKAVATSSRQAFVERVLGLFDLRSRFAFVLAAEDVTKGKPHPEIYETAAKRLAISPAAMMVLEDSENGCRAAAAAGAFAVAVPDGLSTGHDFSCASLVVERLSDAQVYAALET